MTERAALLAELVKELLGPREGLRELLPDRENPRDEYITGVLAPILDAEQVDQRGDIDAEVIDIPSDADGDDDDEGVDDFVAIPAANTTSPSLNPKAQPRSLGISFVVSGVDSEATFEICATWARYRPDPSGG